MELKVFKDTLNSAGTLCDVQAELPVETEILIPDYLPQVFKIVKCFVHLVGLQKQVTGSRLVLDGYLRCVVFYQAEGDQSLCQTEQKLPFTKTLDLPAGEYQGYHVHVTGDVEYLNCRAVNQRRVDVRGAYAVSASVTAQLEQEVITALTGSGAEQKSELLRGVRSVADLDKLMTAEEEINFPQPPAAVLDIAGVGHVQEVKMISGKAVVKGEIQAQVLYRTDAGYHTQMLVQAVPFNQIVDLEEAAEDCVCFASVEPVGCTMMAGGGPEPANMISVTAILHLRVYRKAECCAVTDAFSTQYHADVAYKQVAVEQLEDTLDEIVESRVAGTLPDGGAEIIQCFATPAPLEMAVDDNQRVMLWGRATAHVFCMNSLGEIESYDKPFEYQLPGRYDGPPEDFRTECWPSVVQVTAQKTGAEMTATVRIQVDGMVFRRQKSRVVDSIQCQELLEREEPEIALRIYYAQAGENVFDIAKSYHVSPGSMLESNHLETPQLEEDVRLLVPMNV